MNDTRLDELLRQGREEAELPASFQRGVWQRIEEGKTSRAARFSWIQELLGWIAKPLPATAAWSLALLMGLLLGILKPATPSSDARVEAYAQTINPLAKAHIK